MANASGTTGPPDLGAVFDEHMKSEFVLKDVEATLATMVAEPYLLHVPTLTGGVGRESVRGYYRDHFIGKWPADTRVTPVSRTVGADQVVDEFIVSFTHDVVMDTVLPGVAPTGRYVEVPHVVIVRFEEGRIAHEHVYWDQACVLAQVGLLDPAALPVVADGQAKRLVDKRYPMNGLLGRGGGGSA